MAAAGGSAIYEPYKPGTEPGTNRNLGLQGAPEEIPIRSTSDERPVGARSRQRCSGDRNGWPLLSEEPRVNFRPLLRRAADIMGHHFRKNLRSIPQKCAGRPMDFLIWCSLLWRYSIWV